MRSLTDVLEHLWDDDYHSRAPTEPVRRDDGFRSEAPTVVARRRSETDDERTLVFKVR